VFGVLWTPAQALLPYASLSSGAGGNTFAHSDFTPPPFLWLALFGLAATLWRRPGLPVLVIAGLAALFTVVGAAPARMNTVRLQLPAHVFYVLLAGHGLGLLIAVVRVLVPGARWAAAGVGVFVILASVTLWPGPIAATFTPQLERRVAHDGLGVVPKDCEILVPAIAPAPAYLSPTIRWQSVGTSDALPADSACLVYFRPARCYDIHDAAAAVGRTDGLRADCAEIEHKLALAPLFVRAVAARPDYDQHYQQSSLELGYFRVQSAAAAVH